MQSLSKHRNSAKQISNTHAVDNDGDRYKRRITDAMTTESQDKGSLNAFRSFLNYGVFNEERLMDDTYRHARPYNLVLMSTKTLWIVYLLFYGVLIGSTVWAFTENYFTNDITFIQHPHFSLLNDNDTLLHHKYDPSNDVFNNKPYNDGKINKSIANIYFHNNSFYPYQEYIYLYGHFKVNPDINLSEPFINQFLTGMYLFNYTALLNVTNNDLVLGYESKYIENTNFFKNTPCTIDISSNNVQCEEFIIWSPYDDNGFSASWQNTILKSYKKDPDPAMIFNTTIVFYNFDLTKYGNFSISYVYENEDFVQFSFYVKCVLCGLTMLFLVLWIWYGLSDSKTQKDLIAEQRWMIVLFFAVLLYQDPLTIGLFASDSFDAIYLISSIFFATSVNLFMIYWSLMIDSIREIKNLIDVGVTFGCKFYRGKLIAIFISYSSALIFTCCTQYMIENNEENESYNSYFLQHFDSSLVLTVLLSGVIWFFCVFCFIVWLLKSLWNANKELNKLPYIETRERQLSLRYFKHHTFLVIMYILGVQIYSIFLYGSPLYLVDTRRTNISTLIVVSSYVYLVAFMYLPMTNKNIKTAQHDFQLYNAMFLCHIAWQSYMSPKKRLSSLSEKEEEKKEEHKIDIIDEDISINNDKEEIIIEQVAKWGIINLEHFGLELIEFVTNEKHDMQIVVSHGNIHKIFKKQRSERNEQRKLSRHHRQQLLLAPNVMRKKKDVYQYRQKILDDVSSDSPSSDSDIQDTENNIYDADDDENEDDEKEKNSILSFGAIKSLLSIRGNDRAFSVFNIKKSPKMKQKTSENDKYGKNVGDLYGSTGNHDLSVIRDEDDDNDDDDEERIYKIKKTGSLGIDSSSVDINDSLSNSPNKQPVLTKALSLFSKKSPHKNYVNKSSKQPLLSSYNDNGSSLLTTESAPPQHLHYKSNLSKNLKENSIDSPISIYNQSSHRTAPLIHYEFNEYPTMPNTEIQSEEDINYDGDDNKYDAPHLLDAIDTSLSKKINNDSDDAPDIESVVVLESPSHDTIQTNLNNDTAQTLRDENLFGFKKSPYFDEYQEEEKSIKKRAATLVSHNLKLKKKKKKKNKKKNKYKNDDNESSGFRIPLLSNLLPNNNPNLNNNRSRTLRDRFKINKNKKNNNKKKKYIDIVLGFRGTDSSVNVKLDLKFNRIAISPSFWYGMDLDDNILNSIKWKKCVRKCIVNKKEINPLNIGWMKIHCGFYESFKDIRYKLLQTVLNKYYDIITNEVGKIPRFYICGHSLGGALAQLFGLFLEILFGHKSPINIYVYGCPRVGDKEFSDILSGRVKHLYRVVFRGDIVTTIPRGFAYYKHAGWEIIIDHHGNMINNPSKREKALLPSRTSLKDHSLTKYINSLNLIAKKHKLQHLILTIPK